jgi:hypothetical protein
MTAMVYMPGSMMPSGMIILGGQGGRRRDHDLVLLAAFED